MKPADKQDARKTSPAEVAAMALLCVAALIVAGTLVQQRLSGAKPHASDDLLSGTMLSPTPAQEGVVVTPGRGRLLSVDSAPDGAQVMLDGQARGQTPFSADLACSEGTPVTLEVVLPGYQKATFQLDCVNGSTRVLATLKRR